MRILVRGSSTRHTSHSSSPPQSPSPPPDPVLMVEEDPATSEEARLPRTRRSAPDNTGEEYNSADEHADAVGRGCAKVVSDLEREKALEERLSQDKGLVIRCVVEDGNCLFRAVADQVYGDEEHHPFVRKQCMDHMEKERDHFSPFVTEDFTSYISRKRQEKVYGNNLELQAMAECYNRPIEVYSVSSDPINIFHGQYETDSPPIRLSYHRGIHYNSVVNPLQSTAGVGLGLPPIFPNIPDKEQEKVALRKSEEDDIDRTMLEASRRASEWEQAEKEIFESVLLTSQLEARGGGYPYADASSSSPSTSSIPSSVKTLHNMGFPLGRCVEAHRIFGDDMDSMLCFLCSEDECTQEQQGRRRPKFPSPSSSCSPRT